MINRAILVAIIFAFMFHLKPVEALAGDYASIDFSGKTAAPQWIVSLGVGSTFSPNFVGSENNKFSLMPTDVSVRRFGEPEGFGAPDDSFDMTLYEVAGFAFGPVLSLRDSRSKADDARLAGLHSNPLTLDAGLFAEYWPISEKLRTRIEVRQALWDNGGLIAPVSVDWVDQIGALTISGGPRATFGDRQYMQRNFGVTAAESAANGRLPSYSPSAGLVSVGANVSASYQVRPDVAITVYDTYERLVGEASASPITGLGSANQNTVGIDLTYSFGVGF